MPSVIADNGDAAGRMIFGRNCVAGFDTNRDFIEMRLLKKFGTSNAEWWIENTRNSSLKLSVNDKSLNFGKRKTHFVWKLSVPDWFSVMVWSLVIWWFKSAIVDPNRYGPVSVWKVVLNDLLRCSHYVMIKLRFVLIFFISKKKIDLVFLWIFSLLEIILKLHES